MDLIVAVDNNWGIGYKGDLLCSLPSDMKHFKNMTVGKTIVMGRKTLESFPGKKPLKDRRNIVFSKSLKSDENMVVVGGLDDLKNIELKNCFVVGGENIYRLLLPYTKYAYITKIDKAFTADTFFPNLDEMENWEVAEELDTIFENGIFARILKYENRDVKSL